MPDYKPAPLPLFLRILPVLHFLSHSTHQSFNLSPLIFLIFLHTLFLHYIFHSLSPFSSLFIISTLFLLFLFSLSLPFPFLRPRHPPSSPRTQSALNKDKSSNQRMQFSLDKTKIACFHPIRFYHVV